MSANPRTLDELLDAARAQIARLEPVDAHAAAEQGALLIDIRGQFDRERDSSSSIIVVHHSTATRLPSTKGRPIRTCLGVPRGCGAVLAAPVDDERDHRDRRHGHVRATYVAADDIAH
jgi:hypothetical protein